MGGQHLDANNRREQEERVGENREKGGRRGGRGREREGGRERERESKNMRKAAVAEWCGGGGGGVAAEGFRAYSYAKVGQYDKAIADYSLVIRLDPANTHAFHNRGPPYTNERAHIQSNINADICALIVLVLCARKRFRALPSLDIYVSSYSLRAEFPARLMDMARVFAQMLVRVPA